MPNPDQIIDSPYIQGSRPGDSRPKMTLDPIYYMAADQDFPLDIGMVNELVKQSMYNIPNMQDLDAYGLPNARIHKGQYSMSELENLGWEQLFDKLVSEVGGLSPGKLPLVLTSVQPNRFGYGKWNQGPSGGAMVNAESFNPIDSNLKNLIMHEVGHAVQLEHTQDDNIMRPDDVDWQETVSEPQHNSYTDFLNTKRRLF